MFTKVFTIVCLFFLLLINASAQGLTDSGELKIRINQTGFYPAAPKIAVVTVDKEGDFSLLTTTNKPVFTGKLKRSSQPGFGGNYTQIADFTTYKKLGKYILSIPGIGNSYPFIISRSVHRKVADALIKAFYFIRASIPLEEKYAGKWHRAEG